ENVAGTAEAGDATDARGSDARPTPEALARLEVRQVNLDGGQGDRFDRVVDRDRRVRVRARIEEQAVEAVVARVADPIDDRSFVVRLLRLDAGAEMVRARGEVAVDVRERLRAVNFRLAYPEQLQVRSRDGENARRSAHGASLSRARR